MTNRYDAHQVRDPNEVLRPELHRVIASGIKVGFIAQVAGVHPKTVSGINSGRRKTVTVAVHGMLLEALIKIEKGEIEVPSTARRSPRLAVIQGADPERCGYGHERSEENTRILPRPGGGTKRVCKVCEFRRSKRYREKKMREAG